MRKITAITKLVLLTCAMLSTGKLHGSDGGDPTPDPNGWLVPPPPLPHKPLEPAAAPIVPTATPSAYLAGSGSVAPTGEYRYQIPIQVAPGRAGMQPDLAFSYSSRAGDGLLGVGWSISGLSEIHRCPKTFAIDEMAAGIDYRDNDALCIDGNRLLWVRREGDKDYWVTEQETFARIESVSTLEGRVRRRTFTVYAKDGRILTYTPRTMPDYPQPGETLELFWPLARAEDRAGNAIDYDYDFYTDNWTFSSAVKTITYPGGTVSFQYMPRALPTEAWTNRIARITDRQLLGVTLSATGDPNFGQYTIDWDLSPSTSRPLVMDVQRCSKQTCTQSKLFNYTSSPLSFAEHDYPGITQPFVYNGEFITDLAVLDADGNGADDLAYSFRFESQETYHAHGLVLQLVDPQNGVPEVKEISETMSLAPHLLLPVDSDGDGAAEIVLFPSDGSGHFSDGFRLYRWEPSVGTIVEDPAFPSVPHTWPPYPIPLNLIGYFGDKVVAGQAPYFGDIDGDGRPDLVRAEFEMDAYEQMINSRLRVSRNASGAFPALQTAAGPWMDFAAENLAKYHGKFIERYGESRAALHVTDAGQGNAALTLHQDDAGVLTAAVGEVRCKDIAERQYEVKLDANGDGLHDRLCVRAIEAGSSDAEACINRGSPPWDECQLAKFQTPLPADFDDGTTQFLTGDLTGDGLEDLVAWRQGFDGQILVYRAYPTIGGWAWANDATLQPPVGVQVVRLGDFNGDGRLDIAAIYDKPPTPTLRLYLQNPTFTDKLYEVREDGNERVSETVWYEQWQPATGSNHDCTYPQRCVKRGELTVVRAHQVLNPAAELYGDSHATYYQYEEPRVDYRGRGFLGFETVRTWDPQRPVETTTTYRNDLAVSNPTPPPGSPERTVYPEASVPARTRTVIPILDVPKDGRAPDQPLPATARARVVEVETFYETMWTPASGYYVHPQTRISKEWEEEVCIDWDVPGWLDSGSIGCVDGPGEVALRTRVETFAYDTYNNVTIHHEHTIGATLAQGGTSFEVWTDYDYRPADWLVALPQSRTEKSAIAENAAWETRRTDFFHDGRGLLERVEVEPLSTDPDLRLTVEYKRNSSGLVTGVQHSAPGYPARHQYVAYDTTGVFPEVIWNDLGHARWAKYHTAIGVPTVTLENVELTQWVHDGLGRVRTADPDGAGWSSTGYALRANPSGQFVGFLITNESEAGDRAEVLTDQLGRPIEQRHRGFDGNWIHQATTYDVLGRTHAVTRPGYGAPAATSTAFERDSLDRLTRQQEPDGTERTYEQTFFQTDSRDAELRKRSVVRDVNGRVASTISYVPDDPDDPLGPMQSFATTFKYREFDLVETIEDPLGNTTYMTYDKRGRREYLLDPDAGPSMTVYNGFGERRAVYTPLESTEFDYDQAGRPVLIDHALDGVTEYVWDHAPNDPSPNAMGQLVSTISPDATTTQRSYDAFGRLTESSWTLVSDPEPYAISVVYDSLGRVETMKYPEVDGVSNRVSVGYSYNDRNYLKEVRDVSNSGFGAPIWKVTARNADDALAQGEFAYNVYPASTSALSITHDHYDNTGRLNVDFAHARQRAARSRHGLAPGLFSPADARFAGTRRHFPLSPT